MPFDRLKKGYKELEGLVKEHAATLIITSVAALAGGLLTLDMPISVTISFTLLWAAFGFFGAEYLVAMKKQRKEREEFLEKVDGDIDKRMDKLCLYTTLFTENGSFEGITGPLANQHFGSVKWIIAKFVSEKISADFGYPDSVNEIVLKDLNIHRYSKFATSIYVECESSIYVTSPFTPEEWFKALLNPADFEKVKNGKPLLEDSYPVHVKILRQCSVEKKRLILLEPKQWDQCFSKSEENICFLNEFCHVNDKVDMRFVKISKIIEEYPQLKEYPLEKTDIAIYDRKVTTEWKKKGEQGEEETKIGDLHLKFPPSAILLDLFDFAENAFYETCESLTTQINAD